MHWEIDWTIILFIKKESPLLKIKNSLERVTYNIHNTTS